MIIKVTKKDIKEGRPLTHTQCPIALAIKRQCGQGVLVHNNKTYVGLVIHKNTRAMRNFIADFDNSRQVKPFSFRMKNPGGES